MRKFTLEKTIPFRIVVIDTDNNMLDARNYTVKFNLVTTMNEDEHEVTAQMGQNISIAKLSFFIDHFLNNSIAVDSEFKDNLLAKFAEYENNFMVLPDLTESTLMEVLHSKFNSLCKPGSRVEYVQLYDHINEMNYTFYLSDDDEYMLPNQDEWMGELSFWPDPWWHRSDVSTYDNSAESPEELEDLRSKISESGPYSSAMQAFEEIEETVKNSYHDAMVQAGILPRTERGQLIEVDFTNAKEPAKREKWTPKVI